MTTTKKNSDDANFVKTTAPEVFKVRPRTGGYISFSDGAKLTSSSEEFKIQLDEKISKEFRVQTALEETTSVYSEDVTVPNPIKDAMYTFGISISTLIMLAANHPDIPDDYLDWTTNCLNCIRDDFGNHPPNVQGILNHIKKIKETPPPTEEPAAPVEAEEGGEEGDEEGDQTVRTTTVVKMGEEGAEEGEAQGEEGQEQ